MNDVICKFTLSGGLVVDCCAGTFSLDKAGMLHQLQGWLVRSDFNSECVASSLPQMALIFAHQRKNGD